MTDQLLMVITAGFVVLTIAMLIFAIRRLRAQTRLNTSTVLLGAVVPLLSTGAYLAFGGGAVSMILAGAVLVVGGAPLTEANLEQWKTLTGWPAGAEAHRLFVNTIANLPGNANPSPIYELLRAIAASGRVPSGPLTSELPDDLVIRLEDVDDLMK